MTRAQRIRDWLATQSGPQLSRAIADGVGEDRMRVSWALNVMVRDGILGKVGSDYHDKRYFIAREVQQRLDASTKRERYNARRRKQYAAKNDPEAHARAEALDRARAAVAQLKARELAEKQVRTLLPKPSKAIHRIARDMEVIRVTTPQVITKPIERVETVAEWQARTKKAPEVLPNGATGTPLKFIGHRDLTTNKSKAA